MNEDGAEGGTLRVFSSTGSFCYIDCSHFNTVKTVSRFVFTSQTNLKSVISLHSIRMVSLWAANHFVGLGLHWRYTQVTLCLLPWGLALISLHFLSPRTLGTKLDCPGDFKMLSFAQPATNTATSTRCWDKQGEQRPMDVVLWQRDQASIYRHLKTSLGPLMKISMFVSQPFCEATVECNALSHLYGEDFHCYIVIHELCLPDTAEASPSFDLQ